MRGLMFWSVPIFMVLMVTLMFFGTLVSMARQTQMDNFCEETATVHIAKSCGFSCTNNYCLDKETGVLSKILIVEGEVILIK